MDIGPTPSIGQAVPPVMPQQPMETGLLDLLGDTSLSTTVTVTESKSCCTVQLTMCVCLGIPSIVAFEKNGLKIVFNFERDPNTPSTIKITLNAINSRSSPMTDFLFQAAVPKV